MRTHYNTLRACSPRRLCCVLCARGRTRYHYASIDRCSRLAAAPSPPSFLPPTPPRPDRAHTLPLSRALALSRRARSSPSSCSLRVASAGAHWPPPFRPSLPPLPHQQPSREEQRRSAHFIADGTRASHHEPTSERRGVGDEQQARTSKQRSRRGRRRGWIRSGTLRCRCRIIVSGVIDQTLSPSRRTIADAAANAGAVLQSQPHSKPRQALVGALPLTRIAGISRIDVAFASADCGAQ